MRTRRIYGVAESAVYHCMTRTVNGEFFFEDREKEVMRKMLWQVAGFSGVEVLAYAVMSNHMHVLVRVCGAAKQVSDTELLRRYALLYPKPTDHQPMDLAVLKQALEVNSEEGQRIRRILQARMGDLSEFMKTLKQRFSIWFNRSRGRYGPLWCDRFKSTVIEDNPAVLRTVAAYIDLNPIRAKLVDDPKDYRFCGYAEALAGQHQLKTALCAMTLHDDFSKALAVYRTVIFAKGVEPKRNGEGAGITEKAFDEVMHAEGALPLPVLLRQRIRYFTQGAVIGSSYFVEKHIAAWTERIGDRRKRLPKGMSGEAMSGLTSFKRLRKS
ncbi:MAG: transposase [Opitutales bacterium]|nr:transposase [Opitutales bacterium]